MSQGFEDDARIWLSENAPPELLGTRASSEDAGVWGGSRWTFGSEADKAWLERMAAKGWTAPGWPVEYGGGGLDAEDIETLDRLLHEMQMPQPLVGFGLTMLGPTLLRFGNDQQKRTHLPRVCRGEVRWCQGYSEPDAGSDLASLQMKAVRDGDDFVVSGTKVWTSYADQSDWIFVLVRTSSEGRKQEGITFLLVDMSTPGVSVSPIRLISGKSPFCETHFDEVRVPVENVVHEIGKGWTVAKALLEHERSMIADTFVVGDSRGDAGDERESLAELAIEYVGTREGRLVDGALRDEIALNEMQHRAFELTVQRGERASGDTSAPGSMSSMYKVYGTELNQRRCDLAARILGPSAIGWEARGFSERGVQVGRDWLRSRGNTIEGGTSEVQLNVIARQILELPS